MAQDKPDILKALEEEFKKDENAVPKAAAAGGAATPAPAPEAKPSAPKSSLLDSLLSDARAEADREIQQHNKKLQSKAESLKRAEEEEERKKKAQYEQLFEDEKRKRLEAIQRKEDEKRRKEEEARRAEERRIAALAKAAADKRARKVRIIVGSSVAGILAVAAILVFVGVIPLFPEDGSGTNRGQSPTEKEKAEIPPVYQLKTASIEGGEPTLETLKAVPAAFTYGDGYHAAKATQKIKSGVPPRELVTPDMLNVGLTESALRESGRIGTDIAKTIKIEKRGGGGGGGDGGIKIDDNIFKERKGR